MLLRGLAMSTVAESRRSPRVLMNVPIELQGEGRLVRSHTVVVNRHGAMVLCPRLFREDELLRIQNLSNAEKALCQVVWCGDQELPGLFKIGLEIVGEAASFWGEAYELAVRELPVR